jgi:hypothetical protein
MNNESADAKHIVNHAFFIRYFCTNKGRREGYRVYSIIDMGISGNSLASFKTYEDAKIWAMNQK